MPLIFNSLHSFVRCKLVASDEVTKIPFGHTNLGGPAHPGYKSKSSKLKFKVKIVYTLWRLEETHQPADLISVCNPLAPIALFPQKIIAVSSQILFEMNCLSYFSVSTDHRAIDRLLKKLYMTETGVEPAISWLRSLADLVVRRDAISPHGQLWFSSSKSS